MRVVRHGFEPEGHRNLDLNLVAAFPAAPQLDEAARLGARLLRSPVDFDLDAFGGPSGITEAQRDNKGFPARESDLCRVRFRINGLLPEKQSLLLPTHLGGDEEIHP